MKSRRRVVWIIGGGLCLLAIASAWLARPDDEFAGLRARFHPVVVVNAQGYTEFDFDRRIMEGPILKVLEASTVATLCSSYCTDFLLLADGSQAWLDYSRGEDCRLILLPDTRPWYERAWGSIKRRIRLG